MDEYLCTEYKSCPPTSYGELNKITTDMQCVYHCGDAINDKYVKSDSENN